MLAAWLFLRRVPGVVWAFLFVIALAAAGLLFTYRAGQRAGETTVTRIVLEDSVHKAVARLDTAVERTERDRKVAQMAHRWGDSSRVKRQSLRDSVESMLSDLPEPVVSLIRADDQQIRRDSVTITAYVAVDSSWRNERYARIDADSVEAHLAALGPKPSHHGKVYVIAGVVGAVLGGALVLLAR